MKRSWSCLLPIYDLSYMLMLSIASLHSADILIFLAQVWVFLLRCAFISLYWWYHVTFGDTSQTTTDFITLSIREAFNNKNDDTYGKFHVLGGREWSVKVIFHNMLINWLRLDPLRFWSFLGFIDQSWVCEVFRVTGFPLLTRSLK